MDFPQPVRLRLTPDDGRRTTVEPGAISARVFSHGTMELRWFAPGSHDPQEPHDRDEVYFIAVGTALFVRAPLTPPFAEDALPIGSEERVAVQPGDVLFVPAGTAHHFEACSTDFGCWSLFQGPEGGQPA